MRLEQTIQHVLDNYALAYQQRIHVLDQLFCVIGNGYEWVGGELVANEYGEERIDNSRILEPNEQAKPDPAILDAMIQAHVDSIEKEEEEYRVMFRSKGVSEEDILDLYPHDSTRFEKVKKRYTRGTDDFSFYPLSLGSSALFTMPEDVKPDWLEGAKETVLLLLKHGHGGDYNKMNDWQKEQRNLADAKLEELAVKFGLKE